MTQKEKELLLRDLCARLPYGVKVINIVTGKITNLLSCGLYSNYCVVGTEGLCNEEWLEDIKPYLRSLSSMTEEEGKELEDLFHKIDAPCWVDTESGCVNFAGGNDFIDTEIAEVYTDWLNKKMFDYRGLIPMGLAFEAKEGMYRF